MEKESWLQQCRKKHRFWLAHIQAWQKSGLLQSDYCRQHDLSIHQFGYWKKKIKTEGIQGKKLKFVPLPVTLASGAENVQIDSGLEVQVGNVTIKLANGFNAESLSRAVSILGG